MAKKKTNEEFIREVQDLVGTSYVFLQPYQGAFKKIAYYHVDCGEIPYTYHNKESIKKFLIKSRVIQS